MPRIAYTPPKAENTFTPSNYDGSSLTSAVLISIVRSVDNTAGSADGNRHLLVALGQPASSDAGSPSHLVLELRGLWAEALGSGQYKLSVNDRVMLRGSGVVVEHEPLPTAAAASSSSAATTRWRLHVDSRESNAASPTGLMPAASTPGRIHSPNSQPSSQLSSQSSSEESDVSAAAAAATGPQSQMNLSAVASLPFSPSQTEGSPSSPHLPAAGFASITVERALMRTMSLSGRQRSVDSQAYSAPLTLDSSSVAAAAAAAARATPTNNSPASHGASADEEDEFALVDDVPQSSAAQPAPAASPPPAATTASSSAGVDASTSTTSNAEAATVGTEPDALRAAAIPATPAAAVVAAAGGLPEVTQFPLAQPSPPAALLHNPPVLGTTGTTDALPAAPALPPFSSPFASQTQWPTASALPLAAPLAAEAKPPAPLPPPHHRSAGWAAAAPPLETAAEGTMIDSAPALMLPGGAAAESRSTTPTGGGSGRSSPAWLGAGGASGAGGPASMPPPPTVLPMVKCFPVKTLAEAAAAAADCKIKPKFDGFYLLVGNTFPQRSKGQHLKCALQVVDDSCTDSVQLQFFGDPPLRCHPEAMFAGDVVRVVRGEVALYSSQPQMNIYSGYGGCVMIIHPDGRCTSTREGIPSMNEAQWQRVRQLRQWWRDTFLPAHTLRHPSQFFRSLSQLCSGQVPPTGYMDIIACVAGVDGQMHTEQLRWSEYEAARAAAAGKAVPGRLVAPQAAAAAAALPDVLTGEADPDNTPCFFIWDGSGVDQTASTASAAQFGIFPPAAYTGADTAKRAGAVIRVHVDFHVPFVARLQLQEGMWVKLRNVRVRSHERDGVPRLKMGENSGMVVVPIPPPLKPLGAATEFTDAAASSSSSSSSGRSVANIVGCYDIQQALQGYAEELAVWHAGASAGGPPGVTGLLGAPGKADSRSALLALSSTLPPLSVTSRLVTNVLDKVQPVLAVRDAARWLHCSADLPGALPAVFTVRGRVIATFPHDVRQWCVPVPTPDDAAAASQNAAPTETDVNGVDGESSEPLLKRRRTEAGSSAATTAIEPRQLLFTLRLVDCDVASAGPAVLPTPSLDVVVAGDDALDFLPCFTPTDLMTNVSSAEALQQRVRQLLAVDAVVELAIKAYRAAPASAAPDSAAAAAEQAADAPPPPLLLCVYQTVLRPPR